MSDTIFDKILRKEIPATVRFEDEYVLAFDDINPAAPVHVLVIPKSKIESFSKLDEMTVGQAGDFLKAVARVATHMGLDKGGYRVVFNNGEHGQQTVQYLHAHILGGRQLAWPPG